MQNVSDEWLERQNDRIIDECFVEISIIIEDTEAIYSVSASEELSVISAVQNILQKDTSFKRYGTLETNLWILDGSILWADDNAAGGYISETLADETGNFSTPVVLTAELEMASENLYGVTITWSSLFQEYAEEFTVSLYLNEALAATQTVTGNTLTVCPVEVTAQQYDKIIITVTKWCLPYHRARVENFLLGYKRTFDKSELMDFGISQDVDPINATLPENVLTFSLDRQKEQYDISGGNLEKYFKRKQKITAKLGMYNGTYREEISGGTYYLSEWDFQRGSLKSSFTAKGILSFFDKPYIKGVYAPQGVTLYSLAEQVLQDAVTVYNSFPVSWILSDVLKNFTSTAPLPVCTHAECLQLIAHAAGCTLSTSRDGVIRILQTTYTNTSKAYIVSDFHYLEYPRVQLMPELSRITAKVYAYSLDESKTLYNAVHVITAEDSEKEFILQFEKTGGVTVSLSLSGFTASSQQVNTYAEYAAVKLFGISLNSGESEGYVRIIITGSPLQESASEYSITLSETGSEENIDNPLITNSAAAKASCEAAVSWLQNRDEETVSSYRADPRLDAGDFAVYYNANLPQENEAILTSSVQYTFTGMFRGAFTGRIGYQPFKAPDENEARYLNDAIWPDVNGDGRADAEDASAIQSAAAKIAAGKPSGLTAAQEVMADADRDGDITAADAALVLEFAGIVGATGDYSQSPEEWERFLKNEGVIE